MEESLPHALLDNGKIELLLVRNITRRVSECGHFRPLRQGVWETISGVDKYIIPMRAEEVILKPNQGRMKYVADGEIRETGEIKVRVLPGALTVIEP